MQQQTSPFFQCQEYVAELSKPISLIEFAKENMQNQLSKEQLSNSHNLLSDHKHKKSLQDDKNSQSIQFKLGQRLAQQTLQSTSQMQWQQVGYKESG
ncbi:unnamed protein product (macronuclear) [Paramecium tetraurelia]|uniref:Uncharacterized protein n=1 Tax=Paramecium tetraurelia TaxID=5888 RepID=A0D3I7_PARTE|nr:uncharacterized protein GSPATT00013092001 [Paramecium tetraurelia]CAK77604.1 unnamed protein product [Paramecium tetraurelia]|eukprot:XP_001445001.1 hypothetical protein (macronuclear) [Paramecium tetraurelia strain d4-2]